jgi:hypothetical protein
MDLLEPSFLILHHKKGCNRLAAANDKVYKLLTHGRWFSPGTPAYSTPKTGRHDMAEILLKVALKHQQSIKSNRHKVIHIRAQTHGVLVIGLYELLGNPIT